MGTDVDFNSIQFEKKLSGLKDSQDSINSACLWCLEHKQHHKKIVATWLSVLKRVKVDQRLTLFYLANDVIQYSKRKNFDFVESWGTALQKATTLVRDAKVKHKILRIFKIWEQRGVYSEDFITDLSGLISVSPAAKKIDESHEFQSVQLVNKIRICSKLENETDKKLQLFKQHNPKMQDGEALMSSLKDRAHVDDVEKEMNEYVNHMEKYIEAVKMEIKARNSLINLLMTADTQLEKDRKDVKVVAVAYKSFATRVKNLKKKLEEKKETLNSPIPSPDINAPSPSPDSELELPDNDASFQPPAMNTTRVYDTNMSFYAPDGYDRTNSNNADPVNFTSGFSSFLGSGMVFNMNCNDSKAALTSILPNIVDPPPPPAPVPAPHASGGNDAYNSSYNNQMPLAPPPLPPFTNEGYNDYGNSYGNNSYNEQLADPYQTYDASYNQRPDRTNEYSNLGRVGGVQSFDQYKCDEYNPEEEVETWENNDWDCSIPLEVPVSPPDIEKDGGFLPNIEYHENPAIPIVVDMDHLIMNNNTDKKEIDHRNLISLTGSPKQTTEKTEWHPERHSFPRRPHFKDFRGRPAGPRSHTSDNNESIDMDLSDDDVIPIPSEEVIPINCKKGLLPPPPFPIDLDAYDHEQEVLDEPPWRRPTLSHPLSPKMMRGGPPRRNPRVMGHTNDGRGEFNNWGDFRDGNHVQRNDGPPSRGWHRGMPPHKYPSRGGWASAAQAGPPRMGMRGRSPRSFNNGYHRKY